MILYGLFFVSGASGLVYQVVWTRQFGNVFGYTVYSAALVTSVFMGGLGVGGYVMGRLADARFRTDASWPLRAYAASEWGIALWGALLAVLLPRLQTLAPLFTQYVADAHHFHELSFGSTLLRYGAAVVLLAPSPLAMGGTLHDRIA